MNKLAFKSLKTTATTNCPQSSFFFFKNHPLQEIGKACCDPRLWPSGRDRMTLAIIGVSNFNRSGRQFTCCPREVFIGVFYGSDANKKNRVIVLSITKMICSSWKLLKRTTFLIQKTQGLRKRCDEPRHRFALTNGNITACRWSGRWNSL